MKNKYQEALDNIINWLHPEYQSTFKDEFGILQELVDKEKPMKVKKVIRGRHKNSIRIDEHYYCPKCGCMTTLIPQEFCLKCGQKLDWTIDEVSEDA